MSHSEITPEEVVAFMRRFEQLANAKDFSKVAGMIHQHAVFRFTDGDFIGLEAVRGAFEKTWGYNTDEETYYLTDIKVLSTDSKSASATYTFHWEGVVRGKPFKIRGRGTRVIVRNGETLQIVHEHLSHFPEQ